MGRNVLSPSVLWSRIKRLSETENDICLMMLDTIIYYFKTLFKTIQLTHGH